MDLLRHITACNNAALPGDRVPLSFQGQHVGWVRPADLHGLAAAAPTADGFTMTDPNALARALADSGRCRWRNEAFDVRATRNGPVLGQIDRGAIPMLGLLAEGVHVNGLVQRDDGLHIWVGRRSADRPVDPGKLDHLIGGGMPAGYDPMTTVMKEGAEEAGLPPELAQQAVPVATIDYVMESPRGLSRDRLHCFDLMLPQGFVPTPQDDEVAEFSLWPLPHALYAVRHGDDFKFNVNLVLIDLFLRTGLVAGNEAETLRAAFGAP